SGEGGGEAGGLVAGMGSKLSQGWRPWGARDNDLLMPASITRANEAAEATASASTSAVATARRPRPRLLSVVAPAYNEAEGLAKFVEEVRAVLPPLADDYEILIVDDGSRDASRSVLARLQQGEP